jgi:hypothetical protein
LLQLLLLLSTDWCLLLTLSLLAGNMSKKKFFSLKSCTTTVASVSASTSSSRACGHDALLSLEWTDGERDWRWERCLWWAEAALFAGTTWSTQ